MVRQDRELALRHSEDQQRALVKERHQAEIVQLEQAKRAATEAYFAGTSSPAEFATAVEDNEIRLPWEAVSLSDAGCEELEYTPGHLTDAIRCYSRALEPRQAAEQTHYLRLLLGRALRKSGAIGAARGEDRLLLQAPIRLLDDHGVPFAYYAADRLLQAPSEAALVRDQLWQQHPGALLQSNIAALLLDSVAQRLGDQRLLHEAR